MSLYIPQAFLPENDDIAFSLIREFDFAILVSGARITHLPLLLDTDRRRLLGHVARGNDHWRNFVPSIAIFRGPHSYISPKWYTPQAGLVPTWNYAVVHVHGTPRVLENGVRELLDRLVAVHETRLGTGWAADWNDEATAGLEQGIVAFELPIDRIETKLKLSQRETVEDQAEIAGSLLLQDGPARRIGEMMRRNLGVT